MGGGGGTTKTTNVNNIPAEVAPYVSDLLRRGQAASYQVSNQPYSGGFYAQPGPAEFQAAGQVQGIGRGLGTQTGQGLIDLGQATARGDYLRPESNPYLQTNLDTLRNQAMRSYGDYRKGVTSQSIAGGAYGGDRGQLAQASLAYDTEKAIQESQANMMLQNYMLERQLQQQAGAQIQQGIGLNLLGPETLAAGGQQQRSLEQIALDEQMAAFNEANAAPFRPLEAQANLVYGSSPLYQNSVTKQKGGGGSATGDIIGALLGAGAIGSLFM